MTNLTITASDVAPVKSIISFTGPAAEAITAPQYCRFDTSTGQITPGNGTSSGEAADGGLALTSVPAGATLTIVNLGILNVGDALSALDYGADVFLSDTDGRLADTAGTVSKRIGMVIPAWGATTADKLLLVDFRLATTVGAASLSGTQAGTVANANVIGGIPVIHRIDIAGGAAGATNVTLTHKTRVIDAWAVHTAGAGDTSDTLTVGNAGNAITNAMDWSGADTTLVRAGSINDANHEIAAGGSLRVTTVDGDGGNDVGAGIVYVVGLRVA